ncbi:hypothetical protein F443_09136 [Phytophthora nicotianae P1569]|uniref:Uncharacterized protein n=2 Tax=Phytophthora nicotianae TaxID=4792 RepID=V9F4Q1_PHYNI|nr:hypothetical protein F443_09136 [Phytophthora nicotianae P1569]
MEKDPEPTRAEIRKWPQELKDMRKVELHRKRMLRFRGRRADQKKNMHEECRRLEQELEQRLTGLSRNGDCTGRGRTAQVQHQMQQLVLERECLREESETLRQELARYQKFTQLVQTSKKTITPTLDDTCIVDATEPHSAVTVRRIDSKWQPIQQEAGHRVYFPTSPSFFFHPFTMQEFTTVLRRHDDNTATDSSQLAWAGVYLGWSVYHGTVAPGKKWLSSHMRCSKRMECTIDSLVSRLTSEEDGSKWPIMATPSDINVTAEINIQTVQQLDENKFVLVRNLYGGVIIRYMCLIEQARLEMVEGKRKFKFYYAIGDSKANARTREVELTSDDNVRWITDEGGYSLTLTEVDESSVEVVFDSLGCFESEQQARGHFIMFGHIVTRWDQLVTSSNLLKF